MQLSPHLCFDGDCEPAFVQYQRIFGGSIETMLTYGDSPMADQFPAESHSKILHATLALERGDLTGVDLPLGEYRVPQGFFTTMTIPDLRRAEAIFLALAEGGKIRVPFESTFWSPGFGVVTDRYRIPWEINAAESTPGGIGS